MSDIKPDDLFLIHREGKDYKATVDQFAKDIHINVDACCEAPNDGKLTIKDDEDNVLGEFTANQEGDTEVVIPAGGGGGGLDCAGVVDCFNNAPIDPVRLSIAVNVLKDFFEDPADEPDHWPEGQNHSVYMYADLCDPVTHEIIPFDQEGHGHSALSGSILRLPHAYYRPTYCVIAPSPPVSRLEDDKEIYGEHPEILPLPDLKLFTGKYIKGVTTTDDLWNTGTAVADPLANSQTVKLDLPKCDSWIEYENKAGNDVFECADSDYQNDGMYFYRFEFTWNSIGTFNLVLLMNHDRYSYYIDNGGGSTQLVNEDLPNIQIKPMEAN